MKPPTAYDLAMHRWERAGAWSIVPSVLHGLYGVAGIILAAMAVCAMHGGLLIRPSQPWRDVIDILTLGLLFGVVFSDILSKYVASVFSDVFLEDIESRHGMVHIVPIADNRSPNCLTFLCDWEDAIGWTEAIPQGYTCPQCHEPMYQLHVYRPDFGHLAIQGLQCFTLVTQRSDDVDWPAAYQESI